MGVEQWWRDGDLYWLFLLNPAEPVVRGAGRGAGGAVVGCFDYGCILVQTIRYVSRGGLSSIHPFLSCYVVCQHVPAVTPVGVVNVLLFSAFRA